jgi:Fe-S-cluster containining protein
MSELKDSFSPLFNETGFEARIDWQVSRREFAQNIKKLFEDLRQHRANYPLPVAANAGAAASLLAGIDCRDCPGLCCNRKVNHVSLLPSEAVKLGVTSAPGGTGQNLLALPCKFLKKGQCSVYADRPARCRLYPVQVGGSTGGTSGAGVFVGLDSYCPESMRLGLRVYLAAYDLAQGLKNRAAGP